MRKGELAEQTKARANEFAATESTKSTFVDWKMARHAEQRAFFDGKVEAAGLSGEVAGEAISVLRRLEAPASKVAATQSTKSTGVDWRKWVWDR